jgi:hypothetical protein
VAPGEICGSAGQDESPELAASLGSGRPWPDGSCNGAGTQRAPRIIPPRLFADMTDRFDNADMIEKALPADAIENADAIDPIEPIDSADPTEPTDNTDPFEPTERIESSDQSERYERFERAISERYDFARPGVTFNAMRVATAGLPRESVDERTGTRRRLWGAAGGVLSRS